MSGHDHDDLLPREVAVERVLAIRAEALATQPTERVPLDRIGGRTTAQAIVAETDLPPHDFATMDGFAFDATAGYPYDLTEIDVYPEDEPSSIGANQAVRIATGAPLPSGTNAVLNASPSGSASSLGAGPATGAELAALLAASAAVAGLP